MCEFSINEKVVAKRTSGLPTNSSTDITLAVSIKDGTILTIRGIRATKDGAGKPTYGLRFMEISNGTYPSSDVEIDYDYRQFRKVQPNQSLSMTFTEKEKLKEERKSLILNN